MSISTAKPGRRVVLQGLVGMGLTGCGASPTLDLVVRSIAGGSYETDSGYPFTNAQILSLPYASLGVKVGHGSPGILTLAAYDGGDLRWISADNIILVTRSGRLVKSHGLPRDLRETEYRTPDPIFEIARNGRHETPPIAWRSADLTDKDEFSVNLVSSYECIGTETLTIIGYTYTTVKIRERLSVPAWGWTYDNYFWVGTETGLLHRAHQRYCPQVPVIEYEILKPAAPPP